MTRHIFAQYLRKFGLEVGFFWLLVAASGWAIRQGGMPKTCLGLAQLEFIALAWLTIRLVLAEEGFKVHGGWQTRPVGSWQLRVAQVALLAVALAAPLVLRVFYLNWWVGAEATERGAVWNMTWLPQLAGWLGFVVVLKGFGRLVLRGGSGSARVVGWCVLAMVVLGCAFWLGKAARPDEDGRTIGNWHPSGLLPDIRRQLAPRATDFLGDWGQPPTDQAAVPKVRLLLRVPLGRTGRVAGGRVVAADRVMRGVRLAVGLRLVSTDARLLRRLIERTASFPIPFTAVAALRYGDGTVALPVEQFRLHDTLRAPLVGAAEFGFSGTFPSPLSLPEFEGKPADFLEGSELLFFGVDTPDGTIDPKLMPQPLVKSDRSGGVPPLPANAGPAEIAAYAQRLVDGANRYRIGEGGFDGLPAAGVTAVLERFPWANESWLAYIHPYLIKHVTANDLPILLGRLAVEPRLGTVLVEKGWSREAMPLLRRFARDRVPLEAACIRALVDEQDPALAADLKAVVLQLDGWRSRDMEAVLRRQPGFDWPGYAKENWRREWFQFGARARNNNDTPSPAAVWAAREGDACALQVIAELAACGRTPELVELKALVAGEPGDLIGYLRENIDRLRFDAMTRKWSR